MMHTSSAGGIILNSRGDVVVVNQGGKSWSFPKGHVEKGETPLVAAKREIYEECGLSGLKLVRELGSYQRNKITKYKGKKELKTIHMFLFRAGEEILSPKDKVIREARWVSRDAAAKMLTSERDREFFAGIMDALK
jgi:8-oxo-dGTP pyrophosphatase MutT (NUDIX family)